MKNQMKLIVLLAISLSFSCSKKTDAGGTSTGNPATEDQSASGAVAGAIGGALSNSGSSGTLAFRGEKPSFLKSLLVPSAVATNSCPTFRSTSASLCQASSSTMWLTYDACEFGASKGTWTGVQAIKMSSGTAACGTFPNPGANGTLYRQFVSSANSTTPSSVSFVNNAGRTVTIDHSSTNLGNFDGTTIATINNGGYGAKVSFNSSGARSSVTFGHQIYTTAYDHSVSGTITVTEGSGDTSRTVQGSVTVYHNLLRVIGTSTFTNLVHQDSCCYPVSGSVTTTFSAGANRSPTRLGDLAVGKSETLTFTGCGSATLTSYDGTVTDVSLKQCY